MVVHHSDQPLQARIHHYLLQMKNHIYVNLRHTLWKFHYFCIIQILREINFEDSWSAKSAILAHLEAVNFDFLWIGHFLKAENYQIP